MEAPTKLELVQHAQQIAEHLRIQQNTLLQAVRATTIVYQAHADYIQAIMPLLRKEENPDDAS